MSRSQSRPIDREAAEQLLDGSAAGSARPDDRVARLLAAAAAPGSAGELAGEDLAVAAFTAAQLAPSPATGPEQPDQPGRTRSGKSRLARHLGFRSLGVVAALGGAGVALAAATGVFSGTTPSQSGTAATGRPSLPASQAAAPAPGRTAAAPAGRPTPGSPGNATPGSRAPAPVTKLSGLCTEVAGHVAALPGDTAAATGRTLSATGLTQALASPRVGSVLTGPGFAPLTSAAGAATNVPDYCALVLGLPTLPRPSLAASLPVTALTALPPALLERLPVSTLAKLPASVLATLPAATLATLPPAALARLPVTTLHAPVCRLPGRLATLPARLVLPTSVLARLPASTLATLPTSVLATLPPSVLATLPVSGPGEAAAVGAEHAPAVRAGPAATLGPGLTALVRAGPAADGDTVRAGPGLAAPLGCDRPAEGVEPCACPEPAADRG